MIVRTVIVGPKGHANRCPGAAEELMLVGPGTLIDLVVEPENQHDAKAVACYSHGVHLGYIPVSCPAKSDIFNRIITLLSRCSDQATDEQRRECERFARSMRRIWSAAKSGSVPHEVFDLRS